MKIFHDHQRRGRSPSPRVHFQGDSRERGPSGSSKSQPYLDRNQYQSQWRPRVQSWHQDRREDQSFPRDRRASSSWQQYRGRDQSWRGRSNSSLSGQSGENTVYGGNNRQGQQQGRCYKCGSFSSHTKFNCPANGARCFKCKSIGHFGRVCKRVNSYQQE